MQLWPNMPLTVVTEENNPNKAAEIFWTGNNLNKKYIGNADMGAFWTSQNPVHATALVTSGAGPCQIIIVHCTDGRGALGHYSGNVCSEQILRGIQQMLNALPGAVVQTIVFAAGNIDQQRKQLMYEIEIVARVRQIARVVWPRQDPDYNWGCAMYLPLLRQVALFHCFPNPSPAGRKVPGDGLTPYKYH